ncbi:DVU_1551 family NTP transferase [Desulfitobacterium hafniense]|uniref:DVU_1551 family NTP transferase n=1 Tax=Desulfitobacterium hafniense TaxID=49338 RepID=UPI00036E185E|nr:NTP transferase domain-containing protein [Desulfitobacterium hafniense]
MNGIGATPYSESQKFHIAAIILAAGFSLRMKSFKPLLPLGSASVIETAIQSFRKAGFMDIRVVLGHKAGELLPICDALGVQPILNEDYAEGMFSSVKAGVKSLGREVDGFFLLPADNPLIQADTLQRLYEGFNLGPGGIVYPVCQGKRGHPPLISRSYRDSILSWRGEGGLRALLEHYQADALEVGTEDQGVLLDMDTPEDYRTLLKHYGCAPTPTEFECYELLKGNNTPDQVIKHCETVARLSVFLGEQLSEAGLHLNRELLRTSALLHDIARLKPNHPQEGAKLTAAYPEVSAIIAAHMDCLWEPSQPLTEQEIVYLADKLVAKERIVSLQERFKGSVERHQNEPEVLEHVYRRFGQAYRIHDRVEEILGKSVQTLIKSNLGSDVHG